MEPLSLAAGVGTVAAAASLGTGPRVDALVLPGLPADVARPGRPRQLVEAAPAEGAGRRGG